MEARDIAQEERFLKLQSRLSQMSALAKSSRGTEEQTITQPAPNPVVVDQAKAMDDIEEPSTWQEPPIPPFEPPATTAAAVSVQALDNLSFADQAIAAAVAQRDQEAAKAALVDHPLPSTGCTASPKPPAPAAGRKSSFAGFAPPPVVSSGRRGLRARGLLDAPAAVPAAPPPAPEASSRRVAPEDPKPQRLTPQQVPVATVSSPLREAVVEPEVARGEEDGKREGEGARQHEEPHMPSGTIEVAVVVPLEVPAQAPQEVAVTTVAAAPVGEAKEKASSPVASPEATVICPGPSSFAKLAEERALRATPKLSQGVTQGVRRRQASPMRRRAISPSRTSPQRQRQQNGQDSLSRDDFASMFQVLSRLGEAGELEERVVETIEEMIASRSLAVKEVFAKYRGEEADQAAFALSLREMAASAEVA